MLSDYRGMAKWFGAHYNQEVRFSWAVMCKKGPQILISLLNQIIVVLLMLDGSWWKKCKIKTLAVFYNDPFVFCEK